MFTKVSTKIVAKSNLQWCSWLDCGMTGTLNQASLKTAPIVSCCLDTHSFRPKAYKVDRTSRRDELTARWDLSRYFCIDSATFQMITWWIVQMIVRPPRAKNFSKLMHWKHVELSSPEVGSSKNITGGLFTSSNAMDSRFFCPPDKLLVSVLRCSSKPSVSKISLI